MRSDRECRSLLNRCRAGAGPRRGPSDTRAGFIWVPGNECLRAERLCEVGEEEGERWSRASFSPSVSLSCKRAFQTLLLALVSANNARPSWWWEAL